MLYQLSVYPDPASFNKDAQQRNLAFRAQHPGASPDQYWQVTSTAYTPDGQLLVMWARKTTSF